MTAEMDKALVEARDRLFDDHAKAAAEKIVTEDGPILAVIGGDSETDSILMEDSRTAWIPESVYVGPSRYRVLFDQRILLDGRQCYGTITHSEHTIHLDPSFSAEQIFQSFIHEVIHAIDVDRDIKLSEKQVTRLARGVAAVILDNFGEPFDTGESA